MHKLRYQKIVSQYFPWSVQSLSHAKIDTGIDKVTLRHSLKNYCMYNLNKIVSNLPTYVHAQVMSLSKKGGWDNNKFTQLLGIFNFAGVNPEVQDDMYFQWKELNPWSGLTFTHWLSRTLSCYLYLAIIHSQIVIIFQLNSHLVSPWRQSMHT